MDQMKNEIRCFEDLTPDEVNNIIDDYVNHKELSIKEIIEKFRLNLSPSQLYKCFPKLKSEKICPYCGVNCEKEIPRRTYGSEVIRCPNCDHLVSSSYCYCSNCTRERVRLEKEAYEHQQKILRERLAYYFAGPVEYCSFYDLSFTEKLFVACLVKKVDFYDNEGTLNVIGSEMFKLISPSHDITYKFLSSLIDKSVIRVSEKSDLTKIEFNDKGFSYSLSDIRLKLCIKEFVYELNNDELEKIKNFEWINDIDFTQLSDELQDLWLLITSAECECYLKQEISPLDNNFSMSEPMQDLLFDLLKVICPAQVCCLYWSRCCRAVHEFQKGDIPTKLYARNKAVSYITNAGREILDGKREIKSSRRDYNLPQSTMSYIFFKRVLKLDDDGFRTVFSPELISSL